MMMIVIKTALLGLLLAVLPSVTSAAAAPGANTSAPIDLPPAQLKPGEFIWAPQAVPAGPLVMIISLDEQRAYVYRNGLRIGVSTVSTGKRGKETPTGVFTILQKHKFHKSTLYDDAPMPFMQRLTWDGIALHAGNLPGYPASHGCVRLPYEFARRLFEVTTFGMTVVVAKEATPTAQLAHPGVFAPATVQADPADISEGADLTADGAAPVARPDVPRLSWFQAYRWAPEKSPSGPLTILISTADERVLVIRNGTEIGRAKVSVAPGSAPFGTQAYVLLAGDTAQPSRIVPGRIGRLWQSIPMPGYSAQPGATLDSEAVRRITVAPDFAALLYDQLVPGATLVLTDASILPKTTGKAMTVVTAEEPAAVEGPETNTGNAPPR